MGCRNPIRALSATRAFFEASWPPVIFPSDTSYPASEKLVYPALIFFGPTRFLLIYDASMVGRALFSVFWLVVYAWPRLSATSIQIDRFD
jgi:hypothetical protein